MESFLIKGGVPLHGEVEISGSKNAALPIMAATLLTDEPCVIRHVPRLSDTRFMAQILESLGATAKFERDTLTVRAQKIRGYADYELVRKMRGSICIAGPLLGRLRKARISLPGGCIIGARPINLHLKGFASLGAKIKIEGGYVDATAKKLVGNSMFLGGRAGPTVGRERRVCQREVMGRDIAGDRQPSGLGATDQVQRLPYLLRDHQMAVMHRIEGASQQSPFHVLTCPFP